MKKILFEIVRLFTIIICFILKMARKLLLYFGVNLLSKSLVMILFEGLPLHSEKWEREQEEGEGRGKGGNDLTTFNSF